MNETMFGLQFVFVMFDIASNKHIFIVFKIMNLFACMTHKPRGYKNHLSRYYIKS